ncbi:hypothetical protein AAF712_011855 [Marasmius tenuissimus]|uniref:Uncharacterized protein n=1 Tax=Marasmius tenuissimus TaxID=585030 RepID=A0ABR2ZKU2_9AGAR
MLIMVLEHMSALLETEFGGVPIRLVAHGGACMLLHPGLYNLAMRKAAYHSKRGENVPMRKTTRDVDYIRRSFIAEYAGQHKIMDADIRMQKCIRTTALRFGLGADWMNADADVALPMSTSSSGTPYDPIYHASLQPFNVKLYTVFTSSNKKLTIINVTPAWAVALKLIRYAKWDPGDISLLLIVGLRAEPIQYLDSTQGLKGRGASLQNDSQSSDYYPGVRVYLDSLSGSHVNRIIHRVGNGTNLAKVHWTAQVVKSWIHKDCSAMGYERWDPTRLADMYKKIEHAVNMVTSIGTHLPPTPEQSSHSTNSGTPSHASRLGSPPVKADEHPSLFIPPDPTTSYSSLRPLGPSHSLDSTSRTWESMHKVAEDSQSRSSGSRKKKEKKKDSHQSHRSTGGGIDSVWQLQSLGNALALPDTTNHQIRRIRSVEFDVPTPYPFIPGDLTSRPTPKNRQNTRERHQPDKHADRKRERQRRDRERDLDRRSKSERRDAFLEYSTPDKDPLPSVSYLDESDLDTSDTEEEDSDRPLEYVPMPKPPAEVYTAEWEEERKRQEARWAEKHLMRSAVTSKENQATEDKQHSYDGSRSQRQPNMNSQSLPPRNHDLMMSIYSPPRTPNPPVPAQAASPPFQDGYRRRKTTETLRPHNSSWTLGLSA